MVFMLSHGSRVTEARGSSCCQLDMLWRSAFTFCESLDDSVVA